MKYLRTLALIVVALMILLSKVAWSQTVYKCGTLYTDAPCADKKDSKVIDIRTDQNVIDAQPLPVEKYIDRVTKTDQVQVIGSEPGSRFPATVPSGIPMTPTKLPTVPCNWVSIRHGAVRQVNFCN